MTIHKATPAERQAKLREIHASLPRTPKGYLTAKSRLIWLSYCKGFDISEERARQIMKGPDIGADVPRPDVARLQKRIEMAAELLRQNGYTVTKTDDRT